jgi:multidrug resistance efflux pump
VSAPAPVSPPSRGSRVTLPGGQPQSADPQQANLAGMLTALQMIMKAEREARQAATIAELWHVAANESRRALQARQIFVLEALDGRCTMRAVSSLAKPDRDSPTIRWLERLAGEALAGEALAGTGGRTTAAAAVASLREGADEAAKVFPFPHLLTAAILNRAGETIACLLAVREAPFGEAEAASAERLAEAFGHAAVALGLGAKRSRRRTLRRAAPLVMLAAAAALAFAPVPMTVLAPAEVVSRDASVVTPAIDGVVAEILVDANQPVKAGDMLARLQDTQQRNQLAIAEQEVGVAEARWRQTSIAAFGDPAARRELAVVASERLLKTAERDYARDLLAKTVIRAERDGIAIFADKRELTGRPIQTGQRLMDVADPSKLRIRAQAPVDDAIAITPGARIRFFPDADPLNSVDAVITEAAHQARQMENGGLAFRADADIPPGASTRLGIGHRGTAQILGEKVSLGYYLFRRPLSALRQRFGL